MERFAVDHTVNHRDHRAHRERSVQKSVSSVVTHRELAIQDSVNSVVSVVNVVSALRRCRQPVPARVAVAGGRPAFVTTDRRGFAGGHVLACAGPWRTSGYWWTGEAGRAGEVGRSGGELSTHLAHQSYSSHQTSWNRDEWDVSLSDGAVYRIFQDRTTEGWFIEAIVD